MKILESVNGKEGVGLEKFCRSDWVVVIDWWKIELRYRDE